MSHEGSMLPILIATGSAGRIGSRLRERLQRTFRFVGLDPQHPFPSSWDGNRIHCDFQSDLSVARALALVHKRFGSRISYVVHLDDALDNHSPRSYEKRATAEQRWFRLTEQLEHFHVGQILVVVSGETGGPPDALENEAEVFDPAEEVAYRHELFDLVEQWVRRRPKLRDTAVTMAQLPMVYEDKGRCIPITAAIERVSQRIQKRDGLTAVDRRWRLLHIDDAVEALARIVNQHRCKSDLDAVCVPATDSFSLAELESLARTALALKASRRECRLMPVHMDKACSFLGALCSTRDRIASRVRASEHVAVSRVAALHPVHKLASVLPSIVSTTQPSLLKAI